MHVPFQTMLANADSPAPYTSNPTLEVRRFLREHLLCAKHDAGHPTQALSLFLTASTVRERALRARDCLKSQVGERAWGMEGSVGVGLGGCAKVRGG